MKKSSFAQIILLSLLIVAPNAYAASIIWQEQSTNYQAAESKFATISTEYPSVAADSKLVKSKELLFLATNLNSEYQKLIKIEITESTSIKDEEKNESSESEIREFSSGSEEYELTLVDTQGTDQIYNIFANNQDMTINWE